MKIFKFSLYLLLSIFFNLTYAQKKNNGFTIKGQINGIENHTTILLIDIDGQKIIDSAKTVNEKFVLKGTVEEPTTCWIRCKDKYNNLIVENTTMTYTSSFDNMELDARIMGDENNSYIIN